MNGEEVIEVAVNVTFRIKNLGSEKDMLQWCRDIGERPSRLSYVRWLAGEEGLMGIVEDDYTITSARIVHLADTTKER